jgi:hypothetical protein
VSAEVRAVARHVAAFAPTLERGEEVGLCATDTTFVPFIVSSTNAITGWLKSRGSLREEYRLFGISFPAQIVKGSRAIGLS